MLPSDGPTSVWYILGCTLDTLFQNDLQAIRSSESGTQN